MKRYNCPDCHLVCGNCEGCPRVTNQKTLYYPWNTSTYSTINPACKNYPNHSSNSGGGNCNCVLVQQPVD